MTTPLKHQNNGSCQKCKTIFEAYSGFNKQLQSWFVMFQAKHPEIHISCAGRGAVDQEAKKAAGVSNASYGKSAHNYNCAIDVFIQLPGKDLYDLNWFRSILAPEIPYFINWYGAPGSPYYELPHLEIREWRGMKVAGTAHLVEDPHADVA